MDINNIASSINLESLNSIALPSFLSNSSNLMSSFSLQQMLLMMGGLMLFRFFGGIIFSVLGLLGVVLTCITSVLCSIVSVFIKMFASFLVPFIYMLGSIGSSILSYPAKIIEVIFIKWGKLAVPVLASGVIYSLFFQSEPITSWVMHAGLTKHNEWVSIDTPEKVELYEEF